jgi:RNA polymerase sigma factor (sigma-70 family)
VTTPTTEPPAGAAVFATTRWTQVLTARDRTSPDSSAALESLCRDSWLPLYTWVRRQGHAPADAQDLTQEFFARLLEKKWLDAADPRKGRFRTFLLVALKRFLAGEWDRARAQKRGGGQVPVAWDTALAEQTLAGAHPAEEPDRAYERQWAMTLLERALAQLRREYETAGRAPEFTVLKEYLTSGRGEIPYADVAARLKLNEGAARVAVHRLRKRFREIFRTEIAGTVAREAEVEDEVRHLLASLGQ